jgi:quinol monooxygenase YgiN
MPLKTPTLFMMEDKILGQFGLYTMWTMFFISNLAVLAEDDTKGVSRDFNIIANGLSVLYVSASSLNMIYGNGLPSTMMMTIGPIHQYLYWMLFVYYGGSDVLGSHPIGVYNWVTLFVVGMFTFDMTFKTWFITCDNGKKYKEYVIESCFQQPEPSLEEVSVEEDCQKVCAKFTFKEGKLSEFMEMMQNPETGLSVTKSSEGYINIDVFVDEDNPDVLILDQKWKSKENHQEYVQMRKDTGLFDKLTDMLVVEPEIRYIKALS